MFRINTELFDPVESKGVLYYFIHSMKMNPVFIDNKLGYPLYI